MKRIVTLMLAMGLVLGAVANSSAVEVKAKGTMTMEYGWVENAQFNQKGEADNDRFIAQQRVRTQIDFVASENLSGVVYFEIDNAWGYNKGGNKVGAATGGALGADGVSIETKRAYIDWTVPNTALSFRMGIQGLALPGPVAGSSILDDDVAAAVASYKFSDSVSAAAFWARPVDKDLDNSDSRDEFDLFGIVGDIALDGMSFSPYAMYGAAGRNVYSTKDDISAYWVGSGFEMDLFDPIVFALDGVYGSVDTGRNEDDMAGWAINAKLSYKLDMATPGIIGWYGSGDNDDESDGSELLPTISGAFAPTTFGYDGYAGNFVAATGDFLGTTNAGTWAVGLLVEDIKVIEDLTSQFRVVYITGTNDKDNTKGSTGIAADNFAGSLYLTEKDHAWEVNFDHKYQIYENLALIAELGYINLDLDKVSNYDEDAWKATFLFQYKF